MNHHAQRLLVAASRGARIIDNAYPGWAIETSTLCGFADCEEDYTIHPDDIACQYGPIATELRRMAVDPVPEWEETLLGYMAGQFLNDIIADTNYEGRCSVMPGETQRPWLCLFAAELAADEGM